MRGWVNIFCVTRQTLRGNAPFLVRQKNEISGNIGYTSKTSNTTAHVSYIFQHRIKHFIYFFTFETMTVMR